MNLQFDNVNDYDLMHESVHDSILYWKKVKQDPSTHYDEEYINNRIHDFLYLLMKIENTPHLEWDGERYSMTDGEPEYYSAMIENNKKKYM